MKSRANCFPDLTKENFGSRCSARRRVCVFVCIRDELECESLSCHSSLVRLLMQSSIFRLYFSDAAVTFAGATADVSSPPAPDTTIFRQNSSNTQYRLRRHDGTETVDYFCTTADSHHFSNWFLRCVCAGLSRGSSND